MKLTTLLLITAILQVSASTFAQKVTLSEKNAPLMKVFDDISNQTGYDFLVSTSMLKNAKSVSIDVKNVELADVLNQIFDGQPLNYILQNKSVVVSQKEPSLFDKAKAYVAQVTVTGKVQDETGQPMVGVTVRQKGTNNAAITDAKGNYSLTVPDNSAVISFTYIGYEPRELLVKDIANGSAITLKASPTNLKEVVVNKGYYTTTQELNTGDVSVVSGKTIQEQPVTNPLAALEGRVAGLQIVQQSGDPGSSFKVQLRGQNSIANGNDPLYIIDGVPYASELLPNVNTIASGAGGNPLEFINTNDIQDIQVLKDADATAIYGSRGANGVILITTKKGKPGASKIDANFYTGFGDPTRITPYMNTQQYLAMRHQAFANDGVSPAPGVDVDVLGGDGWDTTRNTDWTKVFTGNKALYNDEQVSLSGGDVNTQYLINEGFHREGTVFPGDFSNDKGSVHFNLNSTSKDQRFKMNLSAYYLADKINSNSGDLIGELGFLAPDAPNLRNPDGSLNWANSTLVLNPYGTLLDTYTGNNNALQSNLQLSYQLVDGLQVSVSGGYNHLETSETSIFPIAANNPAYDITTGSSEFNNSIVGSWIIEPQLDYSHKVGNNSNFSMLIGSTFEKQIENGTELTGNGYTNDALLKDLAGSASIEDNLQTNSQYDYVAVYARGNYAYNDEYLINVTGRRDGSSRFGPGRQFGNFGAVGLGWVFTKESLIKNNLSFLSFGKLRASYGTSGNDQISNYGYLDLYNPTYLPYEGTSGIYPKGLFNPNFGWELNKKLEAAIELGFFQNRLNLNVDVYRNRSSNQLVSAPLPTITGFTNIEENLPAVVQNTGTELTFNSINIQSKSFKWQTSFNITIPTNKLVAYPNLSSSSYANQLVIGQPLNIVKVYHLIGVNPQTGIYQFENAQGVATYNPDPSTDESVLENLNPKFYGGFGNTFSYKSLSLDILFQFVKQIGPEYLVNGLPGAAPFNQPTYLINNTWQKPGDVAKFQELTESFSNNVYQGYAYAANSDFFYGDASFIRLKNLSISWQLPDDWKKAIRASSARIYFQGQNLLTITKYKGEDPENPTNSESAIPPLKVFSMGLQVGF